MPEELQEIQKKQNVDLNLLQQLLPEHRINSYHEALDEYSRAVLPHIQQSKVWARIDKLFSGVPPFNPKTIKELNQGHVVNTDFGDPRSRKQRAITGHYNIFFKNKFLAEISLEFNKDLAEILKTEADMERVDSSTLDVWSQIITEEWTYSKRVDWKEEFLNFISKHLDQLVLYGINHITFPNKKDPRPDAGTRYAHYSTSDAWVNVDRNDVHIVKHEFTAFELLKHYKSDQTGKWDKEALEVVLEQLLKPEEYDGEHSNDQVSFVEHLIEKVRQHKGIHTDFHNTKVEVASLYVKEFETATQSEGVSHIIITPHITTERPIFTDNRAFKVMRDAILISTLLPGVDKIHDAKGYGHISYGHLLELTKMKCNFATNIKLSGTTLFKTETGSLGDIKKITIPVSGIGIVPSSTEVVQGNNNLAVQNLISGVQYLEGDLDKNSLFAFNTASTDQSPVGNVQQRAKEFVELQQNNLAHYSMTTLTQLYTLIYKKELQYQDEDTTGGKYSKRMFVRMVRKGIPPAVFKYVNIDPVTGLPSWFKVSSYRGTGTGSQIGDSLKIQEAYQFGIPQKLKTRGRQYFNEIEAATIFGQDAVLKLYPPEDVGDDPTYMATMASLAANQLARGEVVQFSPDLDHAVFASILLERMQQVAQNYSDSLKTGIEEFKEQERQILFDTDIALQALGNFLGLHLTFLAEDPVNRPLFNSILPLFNLLEGLAQGIHANAQKSRQTAAREQAEQQAGQNVALQKVIFEQQLKILEAKGKLSTEFFKAKGSFNIKLIQAQQQGAVDRIKAVGDAQAKIQQQIATTKTVDNI